MMGDTKKLAIIVGKNLRSVALGTGYDSIAVRNVGIRRCVNGRRNKNGGFKRRMCPYNTVITINGVEFKIVRQTESGRLMNYEEALAYTPGRYKATSYRSQKQRILSKIEVRGRAK
jgi:hypothetical protein